MIGIIPAAGKATRMGEPKFKVKHRGKEIIYHVLDKLIQTRVRKIIIIYHDQDLPRMIGHNYLGVDVDYVYQEEQDGIGRALELCEKYVKENILMILGDVYYDGDLNPARHEFEEGTQTCIFGAKKVKNKGCIKESYGLSGEKIIEKPQKVNKLKSLLGMGIYFFTPDIFWYIDLFSEESEVGITEVINSIPSRERYHVELTGIYENLNYKKDLK